MEEVLGLRWEDIDFDAHVVHVQRAVVHPHRNQPVIKDPKTVSSNRIIPLVPALSELLAPLETEGFIVGGLEPLTYQQQKRSFIKIRDFFGLEGFTAHDFRDTCATEWREAGMPLDVIAKVLGHSNTAVTEKCYVKHRKQSLDDARLIMSAM